MNDSLRELLQATPLARMKLLAVWDGLSVETQIEILHQFELRRETTSLDRAVWEKALSSPNDYVRFLAARDIDLSGNDNAALVQKIESDPSSLVRFARETGGYLSAEDFARCPQAAKLTFVGESFPPNGERFAEWITYCVDNKAITDEELLDVVVEYVRNPGLRERANAEDIGGLEWWSRGKEFDALWNMVPRVPRFVALELVRQLPVGARMGIGYGINEEMLEWLKESPYLEALLWRKDFEDGALRREIFFSVDSQKDVQAAAAAYHFNLSSSEFGELLAKGEEGLGKLAHSSSLSPLYFEVLDDHDAGIIGAAKRRMENLTGQERAYEILRLKLYRLSKQAVPWVGKEPDVAYFPEHSPPLQSLMIKGDTWASFMALEKSFPLQLAHRLPILDGLETEEEIERIHRLREDNNNAEHSEAQDAPRDSRWTTMFRRNN